MIDHVKLRLSAQRALLGRIYSSMRMVKIEAVGNEIFLTAVMDREPDKQIRAAISLAGTEIIADFSEATKIHERFVVTTDPIAVEDSLAHGWIFLRAGEGY